MKNITRLEPIFQSYYISIEESKLRVVLEYDNMSDTIFYLLLYSGGIHCFAVLIHFLPVEENNNPLFFITTMPPTRPADYYLCYLDGCVFIDFNENQTKQIQLIRISFDGYGCCDVQNATPLEPDDEKAFKAMMKAGILHQSLLLTIVKKTIAANKDLLWEDSLVRYGLS